MYTDIKDLSDRYLGLGQLTEMTTLQPTSDHIKCGPSCHLSSRCQHELRLVINRKYKIVIYQVLNDWRL
jgi:hypothetical protein